MRLKVIKYDLDSGNGFFSVLIEDTEPKINRFDGDKKKIFRAWMDVSIDEEYHDVSVEWNQYIFSTVNSDDLFQREMQDDCDLFDSFSSEAVSAIENKWLIYQDEKGAWHNKK